MSAKRSQLAYQSMDALAKDLHRCVSAEHSRHDLNLMSRLSRTAVPGYVITGELGQTPSITVYKALQVSNQRIVALKVITTDTGKASELQRLLEKTMRIGASAYCPDF